MSIENPTAKRSKKPFVLGCLGGGFLVFIIFGAVLYFYITNLYSKFVEPEPAVPIVQIDEQDQQAVFDKLNAYTNQVNRRLADATTPSEVVRLSAKEVNTLIQKKMLEDPDQPRADVKFAEGKIHAALSVPFEGKWINGHGIFDMKIIEGKLSLEIEEFENKGASLPNFKVVSSAVKDAVKKNLKGITEFNTFMSRIDKLAVEGDEMVLQLSGKK